MPLNNAPIQDITLNERGKFSSRWVKFFRAISQYMDEGWSGSFTNGDGDTVTVVRGKITDVS